MILLVLVFGCFIGVVVFFFAVKKMPTIKKKFFELLERE